MNNNFCPNCGFKLKDKDNNYCPQCNYSLLENNFMNFNPNVLYSNNIEIFGFGLSIVSLVCCFGLLSWLSLILSMIGFYKAKKHNVSNKLSIAGIILSIIELVCVIYIIWCFS